MMLTNPVIRDSADFFASRAVACDAASCSFGGGGATTRNLTFLMVVPPDEGAGKCTTCILTACFYGYFQ